MTIQGAKIKLFIKFDGSLEELANILSSGLDIPDFWYDNREEFPYESIGYCETLGFELELSRRNESLEWCKYKYSFTAVTTDMIVDNSNNSIYDLSDWFARYLSLQCDLNIVVEKENNKGIMYVRDKTTKKREQVLVEDEIDKK